MWQEDLKCELGIIMREADQVDASADTCVLSERVSAGVQRITLNRPDRLNALTEELLLTLRDVLESSAEDPAVRCVVLCGAGRAFCAGQDLNDRDPRKLDVMPDLEEVQQRLFHPVVQLMRTMEKPVIAVVQGIAAGAGSSIALAADIVVAGQSAKFVQSFSKVGLSVDAGGGWHLVRALGSARARGVLMTGEALSGAEVEAAGLIWQCVPDDVLEVHTMALATKIASGPTVAYAAIKAAIAAAEQSPYLAAYLPVEAELQGRAGRSDDYPEGVLSFLEKRNARFHGK